MFCIFPIAVLDFPLFKTGAGIILNHESTAMVRIEFVSDVEREERDMKHFGWLRKAAASVLALAMFAAAPAALAYSDANLEAPRAKNVVIDGDLSEWDTSRCLRIDSEKQIVDQIEHWDGEADCSMEIYAMWDEENLQALCHACHSRKTAAEDGGFGNITTSSRRKESCWPEFAAKSEKQRLG